MNDKGGYWLKSDFGGWQEVPKEIFYQEKKAAKAEKKREEIASKVTTGFAFAVTSLCFWPVAAVWGTGYLATKAIRKFGDSENNEPEEESAFTVTTKPAFPVPAKRYKIQNKNNGKITKQQLITTAVIFLVIFPIMILGPLFIIWFYSPNGPFLQMISK